MENDFAVVVGLQHYPSIDDPENGRPPLTGPENDAKDFYDWILSRDGGNVPRQNARLILSSDYPPIPGQHFHLTKPAITEVSDAFLNLRIASDTKRARGMGAMVGRRLYIFMSGHGIGPTLFGMKIARETGLLMSNFDPTNVTAPSYHIPGTYTATWFCENDCFEEVFLFMDCCRDNTIVPSLNTYLPAKGNSNASKNFFAFATKWSRRSRERVFDGRMSGVFTKTLMTALNGACAEPDPANPGSGRITGASLKSFLYRNMKEYIDPAYANDVQVQEPDIDYYPNSNEGASIIIKENVSIPLFPLLIDITGNVSSQIKIFDYQFNVVFKGPVDPPRQIRVELPVGIYLLSCTVNGEDTDIRFEIKGIEREGSEATIKLNELS